MPCAAGLAQTIVFTQGPQPNESLADRSPALEMSQEGCSACLLIKKPPAPVHFFFFTVFCKHTQLAQA